MTDAVLKLARSAAAWNSPAFRPTLIEEIQTLGPEHPSLQPLLQAGLRQTSAVADVALGVHLLTSSEQEGHIQVHLGILYGGIIVGRSCADEPSPVDTVTDACELLLDIDLATGLARATLCDESNNLSLALSVDARRSNHQESDFDQHESGDEGDHLQRVWPARGAAD